MVIEVDHTVLDDAIRELQGVEQDLDAFTNKTGTDQSVYDAIELVVDKHITSPVLERARELATPHVGDHAANIRAVNGKWVGDRYTTGLTSDDEVVLSHEKGSGKYGTTGPYEITPKSNNDKETLAFEVDGRMIYPKIVVHPGVRGKNFMRQAIRERSDEITQEALDESQERLQDILNRKR